MGRRTGGVFLSYRREDTAHAAGRLADRIRATPHFRHTDVFMDVRAIRPGQKYTDAIADAVNRCDVLLALIGPRWLAAEDQARRRRLDDPGDLLVGEVGRALDRGIPVVPVLVDHAPMPRKEDLPAALAGLFDRQAWTVDQESFDRDAEALIAELRTMVPRRWSQAAVVAVALAVLGAVAVGILVPVLLGGADGRGAAGRTGSGDGSTAPPTLSPAEQALRALPRGPGLPASVLAVPRVVDGNTDVYLVDTATGATTRRLTSAGEADLGPLISADRRTLVYQRVGSDGAVELRVVASDGTGDRPLFPAGFSCPGAGRPAWNPHDPTQLAVTCSTEGATTLRIVTLDGATVRRLDPGSTTFGDLTFSPDGSRLTYWGNDDRVDGGNLYTLPADGSAGPRPLTDLGPRVDADPVYSPDGQRIAFRRLVTTDPDQSRIFVANADGSAPVQLTRGSGIDQDPIWSPDGSMIAFKSNRDGDVQPPGDHVWVMAADGTGLRELDDQGGTATNAPAWGNR